MSGPEGKLATPVADGDGERPPMARVQAEAAYARSDLLGRQRLMDEGCRNNNNVTIY